MNPLLTTAIEKANEVLEKNFVTAPPVAVAEIARNYGLEIKETMIEQNDIAGFIDPASQTIFVNESDSPARKAFTIAHELGHWLMHRDELLRSPDSHAILYRRPLGESNTDPIEKQANCFAANLLVPASFLAPYRTKGDIYTPSMLAGIFGVSNDVIGFRMHDEYGE